MKSTGIVRKVDDLGRVVIPMELRRTLGIEEKDGLEIYVDQDKVILRKYEPSCACAICGSQDKIVHFRNKCVCEKCVKDLVNGDYTVPVSIVE